MMVLTRGELLNIMNNAQRSTLRYAQHMEEYRQILMADYGAIAEIPDLLRENGLKRALLLSGRTTQKLHLYDNLAESIRETGARCFVHAGISSMPTTEMIEKSVAIYHEFNCDCIIAFGGGSVIDAAKLIGAKIANPKQSFYQMAGVGNIKNNTPPIIAVATTGCGTESSGFAILRDNDRTRCFNSGKLLPFAVVLDPDLSLRLPNEVLAVAGMTALTHAVEAYISTFSSSFPADSSNSLVAVPLLLTYLEPAYKKGITPEMNMQPLMAPYYAGVAYRRIGFGYTHAFAMALSDKYGLAYGEVCAALFPEILNFQKDVVGDKLAKLANIAHLCSPRASTEEAADAFIEGTRRLSKKMNLSSSFKDLKREDYNGIIELTFLEAKCFGVSKKMTSKAAEVLLDTIKA